MKLYKNFYTNFNQPLKGIKIRKMKNKIIGMSFLLLIAIYYLYASSNKSFDTFNWTDKSLSSFGIIVFSVIFFIVSAITFPPKN